MSLGFTADTYTVKEGESVNVTVAITSLRATALNIPIGFSLTTMDGQDSSFAGMQLSTLRPCYNVWFDKGLMY